MLLLCDSKTAVDVTAMYSKPAVDVTAVWQ